MLGVVIAIGRDSRPGIPPRQPYRQPRDVLAAALATALGLAALLLQPAPVDVAPAPSSPACCSDPISGTNWRPPSRLSGPVDGILLHRAVGMGINLGMIVQHPINVIGFTSGCWQSRASASTDQLRRLVGGKRQGFADAGPGAGAVRRFAFVLFGAARARHHAGRSGRTADPGGSPVDGDRPVLFILGDRYDAKRAAEAEPQADEMPHEANPGGRLPASAGSARSSDGYCVCAASVPPRWTRTAKVDMMRRFGIQAYYGNAISGGARCRPGRRGGILVLAIDDIETSLRCAEMVRKHFPQVQIVARARDRFHAYRLMDLGVTLQMREAFKSSLEMAHDLSRRWANRPRWRRQIVERFAAHDEGAPQSATGAYHDEGQLIQSQMGARGNWPPCSNKLSTAVCSRR